MAKFLSNRDGGSLDEKGLYYFLDKLFPGEVITGFGVTQQTVPTVGVKVTVDASGAASALIPSGDDYPYHVFMDADENVTLTTADGSNPRIDLIVGYVDLSVVDDTSPNNPGAFLIDNVTGTPAGSPTVPNSAAIEAIVGSGNPYTILAQVAVAAGATTITNANITDVRNFARNNPYKFHAYRSAAWTATTGKVDLDAEIFDSNNNFDVSTGKYTVPVSGFYQINACVGSQQTSGTGYGSLIKKNGTTFILQGTQTISNQTTSFTMTANLAGLVQLAAGDYLELFYNCGSNPGITGPATTFMSGYLVSQT